ncbi:ethanolamine utilization protein [Gottschalkia purinilytica]|uniref:Ethanolamine utilization protein n=1 Tax=Gottschalkia purinilytica TaxID=1503 RepID=A0A0L0WA25_GOTPU|nr:ethanolamine utilization protein EutH [Gottschalkia purinilytica]KNF08374.1 ethanolamine utilization protein [Gottschalkia purinilytica]
MEQVILGIILLFSILGAMDKIYGNKFGLGAKFEEGFMSMGNLALAIIGIYSLSPVIANVLSYAIGPLFKNIGIDSSILSASILACDMGGYISSMKLAQSKEIGLFSGVILSSMLGTTVIFTIPVGVGIIKKEDHSYFAKGILAGIITIPLGSIVGGYLLGISFKSLILNALPVIMISVLLAIGLTKYPEKIINLFSILSRGVTAISMFGLVLSMIDVITGIKILKGMGSFTEGLKVVGSVVIVLSGAYPMIYFVSRFFGNTISKLGRRIGIGEKAIMGLMVSLANNIPMFFMFKEMNSREKVLCSAFIVSGAFTFGGQLGFISGVEKTAIVPFIIAKLAGGLSALILAFILTRHDEVCVSEKGSNKLLS